MGSVFGSRGQSSGVGHDKAGAAGDAGGAANPAGQQQAVSFLQGKGPLSSGAIVGLHQGLGDPGLVHKVVRASGAGAWLAKGVDVKGRSLKQIVSDGGFDWSSPQGSKGDKAAAGNNAGLGDKGAGLDGGGDLLAGALGAATADGEHVETMGEGPQPGAGGGTGAGGAEGAKGGAPDKGSEWIDGGDGSAKGGASPGGEQPEKGSVWDQFTQGPAPDKSALLDGGAMVMRRANGDGLETAHAQAVVDRAGRESAGQPLDRGVRGEMEGHFGQSFAGVTVHTDGAAAEASAALGAHAFTVGSDIYFGRGGYDPGSASGKHLVAHELAHVAQGAGAAARSANGATTVSDPADAAEQAAERAADAVVAGQPVADVGRGPATAIHRDAISDLERAAMGGGSWTGNIDQADVIRRVRGLSPADRRLLLDDAHRETMRHIAQGLDAAHMITLFTILPIEFRWRVYWLNEGGNLSRLNADQWQWLIGFATPTDMQALRAYPAGYRLYLERAPANLVGAWDLLEGLAARVIHPDATAVRTAVSRLNAEQKAQLRTPARSSMMQAILDAAGSPEEKFRTVTYVGFELKWSVHWLNRAGAIGALTRAQWGQLLAEADKRQFDELVGWADMWQLVQRHCDAALLQMVRQQTNDPSQIGRSLDDPVQVDLLFNSLGPEGFLALCTQVEADVPTNYTKARRQVMPTLNGLHVGPRLGDRAKLNLKRWFTLSGEGDVPTLTKMFEVRFRVNATDTAAAKSKENAKDAKGNVTTNIVPWTVNGLQRAWSVCEMLPPDAVESNPRLMGILRDNADPNGTGSLVGNAYYWGDSNNVVMGQANGEAVTGSVDATQEVYWEFEKNPDGSWKRGPDGKKVPKRDAMGNLVPAHGVNVNSFNATLRHEIGHAVDNALRIMEGGWRTRDVAGNWVKYASYAEFVDAIIADFGGLDSPAHCPPGKKATWRSAMINTVSANPAITFTAAVQALDSTPGLAIPDAGPASAIFVPARWTGGGTGPWYNQGAQKTGGSGRRFQRAYEDNASLWSYLGATRDARAVTQYQWRAPGEWFAEVYQVYYAEQENDPNAPVGGILRSRDPEAASMMSSIVDRGFSPQAMRGGGPAVPRAGTGGNTGTPR